MLKCLSNDLISKAFLAAIVALGLAVPAHGGAMTIEGITFSEGSSNIRLLDVSGTGTLADPFVVLEEILAAGDAVLAVEVHEKDFGSRVSTVHSFGFALVKVVVNQTRETWNFFNIELEGTLGIGSDYYDGLSFGQKAQVNRPFTSDRFSGVEDIVEPRDVLRFGQGRVRPGERVSFRLAVTHTGRAPSFFLVQHMRRPLAARDTPLRLAQTGDGDNLEARR